MTADEFMRNHQVTKRTSKIAPFMDDILKLRRNGMSYSSILKFLSLNGVDVTMATFSVYMRKHAPPALVPAAKTQPPKTPTPSNKNEPSPVPPAPAQGPEFPDSPRPRPPISKRGQKPEVVINQDDE